MTFFCTFEYQHIGNLIYLMLQFVGIEVIDRNITFRKLLLNQLSRSALKQWRITHLAKEHICENIQTMNKVAN